ncbi:MAG TPA: ferritin family protein [Thermodesulfobacteriota bacterium]|jgi:rubrerythrin|nr:ferritin family protein [Thermodesulfobacteriota bacterium]
MSFNFNADEIFQMGIEIEANGQKFYETVAKNTSEPSAQKVFFDLARWESEHIELFRKLRQGLPDSAKQEDLFDPNQELHLYLKATADSHVFVRNKDITALATMCKTPIEALDLAVAFEKDSVVFYTTMKKLVPEHLGKNQIDSLIDEEITHIFVLTQEKKELETKK